MTRAAMKFYGFRSEVLRFFSWEKHSYLSPEAFEAKMVS